MKYLFVDEILENYCDVIKDDFFGYRNYIMRMFNFCYYLLLDIFEEESKKI